MQRFPDGATLDEIVAQRGLDDNLMTGLGDRIHAFHRQARPVARQSGAADILRVIEGNADSLARYAALFGEERIDDLLDAQRSLFTAQQALIQAQLARQQANITLFKTLGGGWDRDTAAAVPAAAAAASGPAS